MSDPTSLPPVAEALAGRHLVLTGATGFVGKVYLSLLLSRVPQIGRVTLLARRGRFASAADRLAHIFDTSPALRPVRALAGADLAGWLDARVEVLDADLCAPACGLSPSEVDALAASADLVVHCAGLTDFEPAPLAAVESNVQGAMHVADLAARLRVPRLVHVSTCYVVGTRTGLTHEALTPGLTPLGAPFNPSEVVQALRECHEEADRKARAAKARALARSLGWPNTYTLTKALAEHMLAQRGDLKLAILRPSIIECARSFPLRGWNEGLNTSAPLMWAFRLGQRKLPMNPAVHFDVIPVDMVARRMLGLTVAHLHDAAPAVAQLATSSTHPLPLGRAIELQNLTERRMAAQPGKPMLRRLMSHLDCRAGQGLGPEHARQLTTAISAGLSAIQLPQGFPGRKAVNRAVADAAFGVDQVTRMIRRIERMWQMYRPFVLEHDWVFSTVQAQAALARLHPSDADLADPAPDLCWRDFWLNTQGPGIERWAFPILAGQEPPLDAESTPPLQLGQANTRQARAEGAA